MTIAEWVSVSKQLPEDEWQGQSDYVLIYIEPNNLHDNLVSKPINIGYYDFRREQWRIGMGPVSAGKITYWQPLPPPPVKTVRPADTSMKG